MKSLVTVVRRKDLSSRWPKVKKQNTEEVTMKINYLETELSPIGFVARDSLSGVAELVKGLITKDHVTEEKLSDWQLVFLQSKANGCSYHGEDLPHIKWQWPKNTWFQEQLSHHLGDAELAARAA